MVAEPLEKTRERLKSHAVKLVLLRVLEAAGEGGMSIPELVEAITVLALSISFTVSKLKVQACKQACRSIIFFEIHTSYERCMAWDSFSSAPKRGVGCMIGRGFYRSLNHHVDANCSSVNVK